MSRRKHRRATQPDTTRRASAAHLAQGQPLPPAMVQAPHLFMGGQRPASAQPDKGDPRLGIPAEKILQSMTANQAPQPSFGGVLAPGAPLRPIAGIETYDGPRIWEFPLGVNINIAPRSTERYSFGQLRSLAYLYYGVQLAEGVWFDVLSRLVPKLTMRPGVIPDGESDDDPQWAKILQPARDFFRKPDGQQRLSSWLTASARDLLELGLSLIWKKRDKAGRLTGLDVLDPSLWKILIDQRGRLSTPPYPAYLHVVNGIPAGLYSTENVIQIQENGRSDSVYPLSRVEKILFTVQQALRHQDLNYARYTDGSVPEGMLFAQDPTNSADPLDPKWELVERALNGQLAGNTTLKSRIKIIPPGLGNWQETRPDDPKVEYDRWLLNLAAGMFGVTLDELGITDTSNRSVGASQENVIYRRVVRPIAHTYAEVLTEVAQELCDDDRVLFEWAGIEEPEDELKKAQVLALGVDKAAISPTDMARMMKWPVSQEVQPFMNTQSGINGIVTLDMIAKATEIALAAQKADQDQKAAALQQQQLINQQMQRQQEQAQEPQEPDFDAEPDESEDNADNNGGASPDTEPEPPAPQGGAAGTGDTSDTEDNAPDDDAAEVDSLIQQAKATKGKNTNRAQAPDDPAFSRNEWRAWREKALKAAKAGLAQTAWTPRAVPDHLAAYAQQRLQGTLTPDAVRAVFAEVQAVEQGEQERIFGFGGGGHQGGKTQEVHGPNGRIVGNVSLYAVAAQHGMGTTANVPTHDRGHGAAVFWDGGQTHSAAGSRYHPAAEAQSLMRDFFGRDLADHEVAALVGAQPGFHVTVSYSEHARFTGGPGAETSGFEKTPALAFTVHGNVAGYPDVYSAHRLLFREADGTLTMGNVDSNLRVARGHGLGIHIFRDQVNALSHFNVARVETSANGNHHTLARGGTSGFYTWARFGFNGPINWKYITQDLRVNHLPPVGRGFQRAKTTSDLLMLPGGAAEWKRVGESFHGVFDLAPGSRSQQVLQGYLAEKGITPDSALDPATLPTEHAFEQRGAVSAAAAGDTPPDLTPADEAILDRVWASLADHPHPFVEARCMVCGCGEPYTDHDMPYATLPQGVSENSGAMVAFILPYSAARQIAIPGGEPIRDLHCTLAYLGPAADLAHDQAERLQSVVEAFAKTEDPLVATVSGVGRFAGVGDTGDPLYASLDSPTLAAFRARLCAALDAAGIAYSTQHGFTPHVTLAWLPTGAPLPDVRLDPLPVTFAHLWCCIGDHRYAYPLGKPEPVDRAALAIDVARQLKADLLRDVEY